MSSTLRIRLRRTIGDSYQISFDASVSNIVRSVQARWQTNKKFIITDSNVDRLYARPLAKALIKAGMPVIVLSFRAGERHKNRTTRDRLENELLAHGVARDSLILAVGGGVVGDIAGFVAATVLRGIDYIQIPTTLLAQVDSSIGGKVAIDHPKGKNLLGAFHHPRHVFIDVGTLATLPDREFRNGMAEVIKYAATLNEDLFNILERNVSSILRREPVTLKRIIRRCCELKRSIVEKDERESGLRRILNFGHTIGHAVESLSDFRIAHGEAVAIGMVAEARLSTALIQLSSTNMIRLIMLLEKYGLPTQIPSKMDIKDIAMATLHDKKLRGNDVHYTLLRRIGKAAVGIPVPAKSLVKILT